MEASEKRILAFKILQSGPAVVIRRFRGTEYTIHVRRTGNASMTVDGAAVAGNIAPLTDKAAVTVEVTV